MQFATHVLTRITEMFGLQGPESYAYTSMSNCLTVQDVDDVKEFHDTLVSPKLYLRVVLLRMI